MVRREGSNLAASAMSPLAAEASHYFGIRLAGNFDDGVIAIWERADLPV